MEKDWRTDNWGGHYPVVTDPRNYNFARHLREFNYGATYNFEDPMSINFDPHPIKFVFYILLGLVVLANLSLIINVLSHIDLYYNVWIEQYNQMVLDLLDK